MVSIGAWVLKSIQEQDKTIYSFDDDEDEQGNLL